MRELLALATVARLDFWPGEVVERRIYLTWLASRDPWFMLRTIPGTVRGVGGSVVPSSLPANPVDHVIAPRRQFESLFATLLPKDAQVEVEMPDGRRFLMPRKRPQGRPVLLAGLNAREADELLAREAHELVAFGRHIDGLLFVSNDAEELQQGRGAPRHARSASAGRSGARSSRRPAPKLASGSAIATHTCRERSLPAHKTTQTPPGLRRNRLAGKEQRALMSWMESRNPATSGGTKPRDENATP